MGRKKKENKNINISVSLTPFQVEFLKQHEEFNFSKFIQLHLQAHIELNDDIYSIKFIDKKEVKNGKKETTI